MVVLVSFLLLIPLQVGIVKIAGFFTVAVVSLVVHDQDVAQPHQVGHHPLKHLALGFERVEFVAAATLQKHSPALGQLDALTLLERVVIRDHDLGPGQILQHVAGHQFAALVIAVRIVGLQYTKAIADRQARRHEQKTVRESLARWAPRGVDGLPSDDHGHHRGLPRTGS